MDHIPEEDLPDVAKAAHAVCKEAIDAGVSFIAGGLEDQPRLPQSPAPLRHVVDRDQGPSEAFIPSALQSTDVITTGPSDADVGDGWRTDVLDTAVVTNAAAEIVEESFAATQQDRHHHKMHFID